MKKLVVVGLLAGVLAVGSAPVKADDVKTSGRVFQLDGVTPLADATIAITDDKGKVIAQSKSDTDGRYTLTVPRGAFHLPEHKGGNFLGGAAKFVGTAASIVLPTAAGVAGGGAASGVASQIVGKAAGGGKSDEANKAMAEAQAMAFIKMTGKKVDTKMFSRVIHEGPQSVLADLSNKTGLNGLTGLTGKASSTDLFVDNPPDPKAPGVLAMRVSLSGYSDLNTVAQIHYLHEEGNSDVSKGKKSWSSTLDTVLLCKTDEGKPSRINRKLMILSDGAVQPRLVEIGQKLTVTAKLTVPDELKTDVIVVARNSKSGELYELKPGDNGLYSAEIEVDKTLQKPGTGPSGDEQTFSILAYFSEKGTPGRSKRIEDAINGAGLWKPDKTYEYNPLLAASRNRLDLRLTVVDPAKP